MSSRFWRLQALGICLLGAIGADACEGLEDWDQPFRKRYYGWLQSDGGTSIVIRDKVLWVFGDTHVHTEQDATKRNHGSFFSNSIAIHPLGSPASTPPQAADGVLNATTSVRYWARRATVAGNPPWDITYDAVPNHESGLSTAAPMFGSSCNTFGGGVFWPGGGTFAGSTLGVFNYTLANLDNWAVVGHTIQKYSIPVGLEAYPQYWTCHSPATIPNQFTSSSPTMCDQAIDPSLLWGLTVVKVPAGTDAGDTYIFGKRMAPCYVGGTGDTCGACTSANLHLAKVETDSALHTYPTGWNFYYKAGSAECPGTSPCWSTAVPNNVSMRNILHVAATEIGPELSIEHVAPVGHPARWVMVHGGLVPLLGVDGSDYTGPIPQWLATAAGVNYREIVMRSSNAPGAFPGPAHGAQRKLGSTIVGSTVRADIIAKNLTEPGTGTTYNAVDRNVISGYNALRNIHAVKGHNALSADGHILVTYYVWGRARCDPTNPEHDDYEECPWTEPDLYYSAAAAGAASNADPPSDSAQANAVSSFRSLKFPTKYVHPWCAAQTPQTCPPAP